MQCTNLEKDFYLFISRLKVYYTLTPITKISSVCGSAPENRKRLSPGKRKLLNVSITEIGFSASLVNVCTKADIKLIFDPVCY
jgi:hypothetical protein